MYLYKNVAEKTVPKRVYNNGLEIDCCIKQASKSDFIVSAICSQGFEIFSKTERLHALLYTHAIERITLSVRMSTLKYFCSTLIVPFWLSATYFAVCKKWQPRLRYTGSDVQNCKLCTRSSIKLVCTIAPTTHFISSELHGATIVVHSSGSPSFTVLPQCEAAHNLYALM